MFSLAQDSGEPIDRSIGLAEWPWSWVRCAFYVRVIRNVREQVQILVSGKPTYVIERAMPLRWQFFDAEALDEHMADLRGANG